MIKRRHRFKQADALNDRLAIFAAQLREQTAKRPAGLEKADLLKRARMADVRSTSSPGWDRLVCNHPTKILSEF